MVIIPIETATLPLIAAINAGIPPMIEADRHTSFIYHGEDKPNEIVDSELVNFIVQTNECTIAEARFITTT